MRSAGNFSPEWGYLAPAPSFLRTARVVLVATAVGATAGAAVVLSLVDRPNADAAKTQVAAHAIVTGVHAAPATAAMLGAPAPVAAAAPGSVTAPPDVKADVILPAKPQISVPVQARQDLRAEAPAQPQVPASVQPVASASVPTASVATSPPAPAPVAVPAGATGMAALSATPLAASETATSDTPDLTITAPEPLLPQKKAKHTAKPKSEPGLGAVLKHLFSAAASKQSVH